MAYNYEPPAAAEGDLYSREHWKELRILTERMWDALQAEDQDQYRALLAEALAVQVLE